MQGGKQWDPLGLGLAQVAPPRTCWGIYAPRLLASGCAPGEEPLHSISTTARAADGKSNAHSWLCQPWQQDREARGQEAVRLTQNWGVAGELGWKTTQPCLGQA